MRHAAGATNFGFLAGTLKFCNYPEPVLFIKTKCNVIEISGLGMSSNCVIINFPRKLANFLELPTLVCTLISEYIGQLI